jgi:VWFA-related protein
LAKSFAVRIHIIREADPTMLFYSQLRNVLLLVVLVSLATPAQQSGPPPAQPADDGKIHFYVVLTPKTSAPIEGLKQQDFTVLDNKSPSPIASFHAFTSHPEPVEVVIVIDAVNSNLLGVNVEHAAITKFLRTEGGALAYPVAVAAFTEQGIQIVGNFSLDGNSLASALDNYSAGTRAVGATAGRNGEEERWRMSQNAIRGLLGIVTPQRRRKIIVWLSPGWPDLPGFSAQLDNKRTQQLFGDVVSMSNLIWKSGATLYSIDPIGAAETSVRLSYYKQFLEPVTKPDRVDVGDLALEVLAIQSGGLALHSTNDVTDALKQCIADAAPFYDIAIDPVQAKHPGEFHHIEIQVATPGLTARTRAGYYAPTPSSN